MLELKKLGKEINNLVKDQDLTFKTENKFEKLEKRIRSKYNDENILIRSSSIKDRNFDQDINFEEEEFLKITEQDPQKREEFDPEVVKKKAEELK
jgi:hypothetical protein